MTRHIRRKGERGSAMIESALVLVMLLGILLTVFDYSIAIFMQSTFRHAVREGVRYAVTSQVMAGMGQDASITATVQLNAMGFLSGSTGADYVKIRYYDPVTLVETNSNAGGNLVEVSVENYTYTWITPLLRSIPNLNITARSSDMMESSPGGQPPAR